MLINPLLGQEPQSTQTRTIIFPTLFHHPSPASQARNLDSPPLLPHFLWPGHPGICRVQPLLFLNICYPFPTIKLGCLGSSPPHLSLLITAVSLQTVVLFFHLPHSPPGGTSLVVQWLRLRASTAGGSGWIPGQGAKISHMPRGQKKES